VEMRILPSILLVLALVSCGAPSAGGPKGTDGTRAGNPEGTGAGPSNYDPYAHPCKSDSDCDDAQYCDGIGVGIEPAGEPRSTVPEKKYCLRKNSGDCCPPGAAPARPL